VIDERFRAIADAVPNVRVIAIPKPESLRDYFRLRRQLRAEEYDVLLAMQASFRVNLLYGAIRARRKIGFDPRRARDLQQVFMGELIHRRDEHLLDGFFQFVNKVGVPTVKTPSWPTPFGLAEEESWWKEQLRALNVLAGESSGKKGPRFIAIQMGASKAERCWPAARYAELGARFTAQPELVPVLIGGASPAEFAAAEAFRGACRAALDLTGKTNLTQLQLLLSKAAVVISPDTAAVHIARAANVPVVGLYAVARPQLSGPYRKLDYTIDRYEEAVRQIAGLDPADKKKVDWHFRVHDARAMDLISAEEVWSATQKALKA
jgi:heptosyltransferase I